MKKIFTIITALILFGSMTVVQAVDYYVAGSFNVWNTISDDNKMSLVSGTIYSKTFSEMGASSYEFKISTYNWGTDWGSGNMDNIQSNISLSGTGNISFTLTTACNVTFYFDAGNTKIYVLAIPTSSTYAYTVVGSSAALFGSAWDTDAAANDMTLQGDGITYKKTYSSVHLAAGDISYKVAAEHAWSKTGEYPTSGNNTLSISGEGDYDVTFTYVPSTPSLTAVATPLAPPAPATIKLHGNFTGDWANTDAFVLAGNEETASLTLTDVTKGDYQFGVRIGSDDNWTSNGSAFTRANNSHAIAAGSGNCTFNADRNGDYTFTWTYATNTLAVTYPDIPSQSVAFTSLASEILKSSVINLANCVTSSGIDNPTYRFYIKEKNGSYGDAINANYNFNTNGEYVVKVEALEYGEVVAYDESAVVVYQSYTFTNGYTLYVDFSAVSGDVKGVNYPKVDQVGMDWDGAGAGTVKAITFTTNVTWTTMAESFIKTEKNGWVAQPFTVPGIGKNCIKVAADGASYTWDTYVDLTTDFYLAGSFNGWSPTANRFMKASTDATEASVTITVSEYSNITFKVIDNGAWRGCNPAKTITKDDRSVTILSDAEGNNVAMTPYAAGDYIFTLNLSTRELTVTYPDGEQMPIPQNIYLSSDELNEWAPADPAYKFTVSGDIATLDVTLAAATDYAFKLVYNGAWLGANYDFKYYWCTDVPMIVDETQANLFSFKAGTYTFRYKLSTGELSIVYPATSATDVTISQYEYATLYSATAFDVPAEVEAYIISGVDGIKLTMERIYRIPAETGVLLHAPQGTYPFYEGDGRWMDAPASNLLKGSTTNETIDNDQVHYVLSYDTENQVGFYWPYGTGAAQGVGSFVNNAGKAYVEIPADEQPVGVIARRGFPFRPTPQVATDLEQVPSYQVPSTKVLIDGQLFIIRDGMLFNAQGARVQ